MKAPLLLDCPPLQPRCSMQSGRCLEPTSGTVAALYCGDLLWFCPPQSGGCRISSKWWQSTLVSVAALPPDTSRSNFAACPDAPCWVASRERLPALPRCGVRVGRASQPAFVQHSDVGSRRAARVARHRACCDARIGWGTSRFPRGMARGSIMLVFPNARLGADDAAEP